MKYFLIFYFLFFELVSFAQKPNVVVILTDDLGTGDISGYRKKNSNNIIVNTPQIDKLMEEGIHFTDAHSPTALCAPSRYCIMTGNNTYRSYAPYGVWGSYQENAVEPTDATLGRVMKKAGYNTSFFGKWHIGADYNRKGTNEVFRGPRKPLELDVDVTKIVGRGPKELGFDYSFMYPAGIQDVPYVVYENEDWYKLKPTSEIDVITNQNIKKFNEGGIDIQLDKDEGLGDTEWNPIEMGPLLATKAVNYINDNAGKADPFFMYYCTQSVHIPHTPPATLNGRQVRGSTPIFHLDMVTELDVQVEMIVNALKAKGVYDNTLIIFTSDNGGLSFPQTLRTGHRPSDIYRGAKNQVYEGGHRVPFIAVWPNKIPANTNSSSLAGGQDILATIAAAAEETITEKEGNDSFNLLPIMKGEANAKERKFLMLQAGTGREIVYREGDWKLIMDYNNGSFIPRELYNLNSSPNESFNQINSGNQKDRVQRMLGLYKAIRNSKDPTKTLHDKTIIPEDPDPVVITPNENGAPINGRIILRKSAGDKKIVSIDGLNTNQLNADKEEFSEELLFTVEEHPLGGIALLANNGRYIRVLDRDQTIPIRAEAAQKGSWTQFSWKSKGEGKVALRSVHSGKWIQASWDEDNAILRPVGDIDGDWETFDYQLESEINDKEPATPEIKTNNFTIKTTGLSCPNSDNGSILIDALEKRDYVASLTGRSSVSFDKSASFNDLKPGNYKLSIEIEAESFKQNFNIVVSNASKVKAKIEKGKSEKLIKIKLSGANDYKVTLNDEVFYTKEDVLTLELKKGENLVKVKSGKECQGEFSEKIFFEDQNTSRAIQNPIGNTLNIPIYEDEASKVFKIKLYSVSGELLLEDEIKSIKEKISVNFDKIIPGIYFLNLETNSKSENYKLIKE